MKSEIITKNNVTCLRINGHELPFAATRSFRPESRIIHDFSAHGIRLFNIFPSGIMTALNKRTVPYSRFGSVWVGDHEYNWDNLRAQCNEFFPNLTPDDYISLSIHLDPPDWYVVSHPELVDHWEQMIQNLGSEAWRRDAADYLRALIDKMDEWYPERVYGFFLLSGGTTEWYSYLADRVIEEPTTLRCETYRRRTGCEHPDADTLRAASDGMLRHPVKDADAIRFWRDLNESIMETVLYFAHVTKEHTQGNRVVGLFNAQLYGMQLDLGVRNGYNEPQRLLDSPDIDMIFCPASYICRKLDSTSAIRVPADSFEGTGTLYVHEIDSSTHLVKTQKNSADGIAAVSHGRGRDEAFTCTEDSRMYIRREVGMVLAKGAGYWWFDMFSGYYDDPRLMAEIETLYNIQRELMNRDNAAISEVCEMLDSHSNYMLRTGCHYPMAEHQSPILNTAGAPWDMRMTADFFTDRWRDKYKLYLFPALFAPDKKTREKIAVLRESGANMLFMHAPGYITDNGFSEAAMEALTGIHLRRTTLSDNTIEGTGEFAGISWNFINESALGEVTVTESRPRIVENVSPIFAADHLDVVFGCFRETGDPACGLKFRPDGGFDAFSACAPIPLAIIREIYRRAGIFLYADRPVPIYTNAAFACVYCYEGGELTLYRPEPSVLTDCFTGEEIPIGPEGKAVFFAPHETRFFYVRRQ